MNGIGMLNRYINSSTWLVPGIQVESDFSVLIAIFKFIPTWESFLPHVWCLKAQLEYVEEALLRGMVNLIEVGISILGILLHHLVPWRLQHECTSKLQRKYF